MYRRKYSNGQIKDDQQMVAYSLYYFPVRNLAEPIRMMFHYHGQKFEDIRITPEEWPKRKSEIPFGKLPMLTVDGKQLVQSQAILRFLARRFHLAGKDVFEQSRVDELADLFLDVHAAFKPFTYVVAGIEKGDQTQLRKTALHPSAEKYFPLYSKILKEVGTGYLVTKKPTFVDFQLADFLFTIRNMAPETFDHHLDLSTYIDRIYSLSPIKKYIVSRPATQL
ncbi:hypothetical protein M3Y97_00727400 [Aphelenchoides bicaudatus]|nr:hypothetical protein M3Y97_00727400 [Aphelenchoides bicaudatus]